MRKRKLPRPSAALVIALIALLASFGGQALAGSGHGSRLRVRSGKIVDHDSTLGDGNFNFASGHAVCKHGERLVSGGIRNIGSTGLIPGLRWAVQESGPVPSKREWSVLAASDLGGLGRKDFVVIAVCEAG